MNRDKLIDNIFTVFILLGICCILDAIFLAIVLFAPLGR